MPWKQMPDNATAQKAKVNARKLRHAMTDAEKQLWTHLRDGFAGNGTHFRRQVAIGQYVADFCCLRHRLIVELDGPIHRTVAAKVYDRGREQALKAGGYRVLRFSNEDIVLDFKSALDRIASALAGTTPTPNPSPQGGGELALGRLPPSPLRGGWSRSDRVGVVTPGSGLKNAGSSAVVEPTAAELAGTTPSPSPQGGGELAQAQP